MSRKQRRAAAISINTSTKELFATGLGHHRAGRLAEAEACYRRILVTELNHAEVRANLGLALKDQGKLEEAVAVYRQAIGINPNLSTVHSNLGNALKDQGKLKEAVAAYRQAIQLKPDLAEAHSNLGNALTDEGNLDEAIAAYRRAIAIKPDYARAHFNLGNALTGQGKFDEAIGAYRQAIRIKPDYAEAEYNLGIALKDQGKLADATAAYRRAIDIKPHYAEAHSSLGDALNDQGNLEEAITAYRQAIRVKPDFADGHYNLGNALKMHGRFDEAIAAYHKAISLNPDHTEAHCNIGVTLSQQDKLDEAVAAYRRALFIKPELAEAHSNLGAALESQGKLDEAIAAYRQAIHFNPSLAEAHSNLGNALKDQWRLDEAIGAYHRAIGIKADFAEAHSNLGNALKDQAKLDEAIAAYRQAIDIKIDYTVAHSNLLFALNYDEKWVDRLLAAHQEWGERHGRRISRPATYANERRIGRRLKLGYVSPDFRRHSVAYFVEPLLRGHDRQAVEVFCYAEVKRPDGVTRDLQRLADHWLATVGLSDEKLAERIRADGIDILIDLAGHTANNRLRLFACKPAPIQVTWLGYPNTTGLEAIDYRLVDAVTDPVGEADSWASETLVRLDGGFLCYGAPKDAPELAAPPCLKTGTVTFGSFNNPIKVSAATFDAWATLLCKLPQARLLLKGASFADATARAVFLARLRERGVAAERVELVALLSSTAAHLAFYNRMDIALDPFPYNGTTTTCEALWMGVPVITLRGDRHAGRVGASLLNQIGLTDWIANSVDEYVEIAQGLARNPGRLGDLRLTLRPRMAISPLCDGPAFARKMEVAFRTMWQRWCEAPDHRGV